MAGRSARSLEASQEPTRTMGITDKSSYIVQCTKCSIEEEMSVLEYGSAYGASWGSPPTPKHFAVDWRSGPLKEPRPISGKCLNCGGDANIESLPGM